MIYGNTVGGSGGSGIGKTFIIEDAAGNELVGIVVDEQVVFDAGPNDIRAGKVAATQNGVTIGEKVIPSYNTSEGFKLIPNGSSFLLPFPNYSYTKLQAIICPFDTSLDNSVAADKVAINDRVYPVQSTIAEATISKDDSVKAVNFGITNMSGVPCLIRYFSYKEIY